MHRHGIVLVLCLGGLCLAQGTDPCDKRTRTKVPHGTVMRDGSLETRDGTKFQSGTYWRGTGFWWACPCLNGPCVRQCSIAEAKRGNFTILQGPVETAWIHVWDGENVTKVDMNKHFGVVYEAECGGFMLDPENNEMDEYRILSNGSIYSTHPDIVKQHQLTTAHEYCLMPPLKEGQKIMMGCKETSNTPETEKLQYQIYPALFILSAIFLTLTLLAFILTPERNSIHSKAVVCQSGSLLVTYVCLTITYLTGEKSHADICVIVAYIMYYFLMASFFWMNVMCIDIYLTFAGSMLRSHKRKFRAFFIYGWCSPLAFFVLTVFLDMKTQNPTWSPAIGLKRCWFQGFWSDFLYFDGPISILLLINSYLFGKTVWHLRRYQRETKGMLRRGDSQVHNQNERNRLRLYVKLFFLMGFTWFMEIISWAVGGQKAIWFITDSANCLSGVFVFWLCVWSNETMRKSLRDRFWHNGLDIARSSKNTTSNNCMPID
ncbi:G-protein coupled receptor Mth2-like [Neocloeon triangulifer]|uniref:G-protein coupled receptor Mth2-like n=1 Tax=Neocloeon triangulifer TaxID=2078957 RepID=UPI00286F15AC|nr:G-protein coupled receptor Mth2-like [Neocloeon triangulifer]